MTKVTLHPSLPLTPFAQANLQELKFGPDAPLTPLSQKFERRDLNWFGRCVQKIDESNSRILKTMRKVVLIVLFCSMIGIPIVNLHNSELTKQRSEKAAEKNIIATLNRQNAKINKRAEIVEALGLETFKKAPQIDLKGRVGQSDYIDFIKPKDLTSSIMKGQDTYGRAFISLKLQKMTDSQGPLTGVFTLFERYASGSQLVWCFIGSYSEVWSMIQKKDMVSLRQIIHGTHPGFKLAS